MNYLSIKNFGLLSTMIVLFMAAGACTSRQLNSDPLTIADEMELVLTKGMMDHWYPRCIDKEYGGYLSSFDKDWKQKEHQLKFIVMQARHTWASAQMAEMYPENPLYLEASEHGYHYLRDVMWDKEYGGYYTTLNRQGEVIEDEDYELTKLAYGNAFAIYGLSAYYAVSGDQEALEQAIKSFRWLDKHSYDPLFGGYFQFMLRDGTALKEGHQGTPPKDQNSSIHILEGFTALYKVWPDEHLKSRIHEMLTIIRDTITTEKGYMQLFFRQDWSPVYYTDEEYKGGKDGHLFDYISFGHDIETAFLMLEASFALGRENDLKTQMVARRMTDHTISNGWDPLSGATYESAYYYKDRDGITILDSFTQWWAATESFHTLLIMSELYPDDPRDYYKLFTQSWDYCKKYLIDHQRGGWYRTGTNENPWEREEDKASIWKGNYHSARSLINCMKILRKPESKMEEADPPSFLIIFTDDQGYDDLSHHGNLYLETPNIDRLARESVELTNFHAAPLCAPSRASLLTGRHFLNTGVWGVHRGHDYLNLDETTIAELLQNNGYATGMMGKWHSGHPDAWQPWSRGFDHAWVAKLYQHGDCLLTYNGQEQHRGGWATDTLTEIAIDFMRDHAHEPFFCYLPYMAPHGQWRAPESFADKYRAMGQSEELATVNAMIDHIDVNVGRLMDFLETSGLAENTVVIFTTDNGPVQQTHGAPPSQMSDEDWKKRNPSKLRGSKGTIWENGTRVPFFVRWPGVYEPAVIDKNAQLIDLFPTILDIAGIELPADNKALDGVSLSALFQGNTESWEDRLLFIPKDEPYWPGREGRNSILPDKSAISYENQVLTVRNQEFKLVKHYDAYHLFNIPNDPREENDIIHEHPEITKMLKNELEQWYEEILASESSYTHPRFLIGEEDIPESYIYTCAAASATGNVKGGSHATSNWLEKGDAQTVLVEVLRDGRYHFSLDARVTQPGATIGLSIGESRIEAKVSRGNRIELGEMDLTKGSYDLEIKILEADPSQKPVFKEVKGVIVKKIP